MSKKKSLKEDKLKKLKALEEKVHKSFDQDGLDFGGLPKDISLKKNLGCGG